MVNHQRLSDGIFDMRQDLGLTLEELYEELQGLGLDIWLWTLQEIEDVNEHIDISLYNDVYDYTELLLNKRDEMR